MADYTDLIARLEKATAPTRPLFEESYLAAHGKPCWDDGDDGYFFNECLDIGAWESAALTLVPEGWYWRAGKTTLFAGWAFVHATHPDHGEPGRNEFWHKSERDTTPALALVIAALKARQVGR